MNDIQISSSKAMDRLVAAIRSEVRAEIREEVIQEVANHIGRWRDSLGDDTKANEDYTDGIGDAIITVE